MLKDFQSRRYYTILSFLLISGVIFLNACSDNQPDYEAPQVNIIPLPTDQVLGDGDYTMPETVDIFFHSKDTQLQGIADYLVGKMSNATNHSFHVVKDNADLMKEGIHLMLNENPDTQLGDEGYQFEADKAIIITANTPNGIFYGVQTLLQLLPPAIMGDETIESLLSIPKIKILDKPRFQHRGMMLDVCRHFVTTDSVKRFIDLLAMHKMNSFHWHLTEDQGWRIEIKKYPQLIEVGSWRKETVVGKNYDPYIGDGKPHGGFYTQEEIKDIVQYASERFINIIPEIEFPGHSLAALASYPNLGCTGGPYEVSTGRGVHNDVLCAGNDEVFEFAEAVLNEVMELFPSKYIHIGGDECPKDRWKECSKCQARIKEEGLKDEYELQSYFIKRLEKILNANGRDLIGWDEILEGGLAPNATVMSWRGMEGGIEAARQNHKVIMSPVSHCYFDYYQADPESEPLAIGGYTPLKKVYSFEPIPEELNEEEAKMILGAQANLWTEYVPNYRHAEYMVTPRISALAEVVWSTPGSRNWEDFQVRIQKQMKRFDALDINYSKGSFRITFTPEFTEDNQQLHISLTSERSDIEIFYTTDGTEPTASSLKYSDLIPINENTMIKAGSFIDGELQGNSYEKEIVRHKAVGKKITYNVQFSSKYTAGGELGLLDGIFAPVSVQNTWQGFQGTDFTAIIDLGEVMEISEISTSYLSQPNSWVYRPNKVVYSISVDGNDYKKVFEQGSRINIKDNNPKKENFSSSFVPIQAQYVKVFAEGVKKNPEWHRSPGGDSWVFIDEIIVN